MIEAMRGVVGKSVAKAIETPGTVLRQSRNVVSIARHEYPLMAAVIGDVGSAGMLWIAAQDRELFLKLGPMSLINVSVLTYVIIDELRRLARYKQLARLVDKIDPSQLKILRIPSPDQDFPF